MVRCQLSINLGFHAWQIVSSSDKVRRLMMSCLVDLLQEFTIIVHSDKVFLFCKVNKSASSLVLGLIGTSWLCSVFLLGFKCMAN